MSERDGVIAAASGKEAEKLYGTIMAAVTEAKPEKVAEFQAQCQSFGTCTPAEIPAASESFYQFMITDIGEAFWKDNSINLVRLLPDGLKRKALMEASGLLAKPKVGIIGGMFGMVGAVASASMSAANEYAEKQKVEAEERKKVEDAAAAEAAEKRKEEMEKARVESEAARDGAYKEKWVPTYINDEQKPIAEIIEELEHNDLWKDQADDAAALTRCVQYAGGLCQMGERTVKGWHVKSLDPWGLQQPWVLVLCSMSFFRVTFDVASGKIGKYEKFDVDEIDNIVAHKSRPGCMKLMYKPNPNAKPAPATGGFFGFGATSPKKDTTSEREEVYFAQVPAGSGLAVQTVCDEMIIAFQKVHRRFISAEATEISVQAVQAVTTGQTLS
jgi:hypothetical protein